MAKIPTSLEQHNFVGASFLISNEKDYTRDPMSPYNNRKVTQPTCIMVSLEAQVGEPLQQVSNHMAITNGALKWLSHKEHSL